MRTTIIAGLLGFVALTTASSALDARLATPRASRIEADPCTFFSKAELESAFGLRFGPPQKGSTITGPSCMFRSDSIGTFSVLIDETVTRAQFDTLRTALGTSAESVNGIGQAAFFWRLKLWVQSNGRQFVIGTSGEMTPRVRAALLKLGRLGAPRLRP